jgi:hypothetical protein
MLGVKTGMSVWQLKSATFFTSLLPEKVFTRYPYTFRSCSGKGSSECGEENQQKSVLSEIVSISETLKSRFAAASQRYGMVYYIVLCH